MNRALNVPLNVCLQQCTWSKFQIIVEDQCYQYTLRQRNGICVNIEINRIDVKFQLDCGAVAQIIKRKFVQELHLKPTTTRLRM